jgi:uncharacterized membrane protein YgdD (TMEM256/DUF423 family)
MLSLHAAAVLGGAAVLNSGMIWRPLGAIALFGLVLGALLFAGDIALRAFAGHRLSPMAAPTGGTIMIVSWLAFAVAAIVGLSRGA